MSNLNNLPTEKSQKPINQKDFSRKIKCFEVIEEMRKLDFKVFVEKLNTPFDFSHIESQKGEKMVGVSKIH